MDRKGFTLLELLVAMAIFSVMSVMAYSGLRSMIDTREHVEKEALQLAELQTAFTFLGRDIQQALARTVRDENGDLLSAMAWDDVFEPHIEFTKTGYHNPTGRPRSNLQRVKYQLADGELRRYIWGVLDRAPESEPFSRLILSGVESFTTEFLDAMGQWHTKWPVNPLGGDISPQHREKLAKAVRISLDVKGWGRIQRLFFLS
jgi:general secretion pathway protein J